MQQSPDDRDPIRGRYRLGRVANVLVFGLLGALIGGLTGDRPFVEAMWIAVPVGMGFGLLLVGIQWWFGRRRDLR